MIAVWFYSLIFDAMASNASRPHPYLATSDIETPGGIHHASWFAGPGGLPAGIRPPPDRPILVIVDYSPLQALTHPSERDHELFHALAIQNFRCATAGEMEALFTWARRVPADEANSIQFNHVRLPLTTRLRTQCMGYLHGPVRLGLRYADLNGDIFQVREDWTIMHLLEEYRPEWRIRQYNYMESSFLVPGTEQPFILRLTCHRVRQGVISP